MTQSRRVSCPPSIKPVLGSLGPPAAPSFPLSRRNLSGPNDSSAATYRSRSSENRRGSAPLFASPATTKCGLTRPMSSDSILRGSTGFQRNSRVGWDPCRAGTGSASKPPPKVVQSSARPNTS